MTVAPKHAAAATAIPAAAFAAVPEAEPAFEILISIINYRTAEMTIDCLKSTLADLDGIRAHVVVVDNLSGDGSDDVIETWITGEAHGERVSLVRSPTNSGFAGGHNQTLALAAEMGGAEFVVLLNSDALVRPGAFRTLIDAARADPRAGLIAPRIDYEDGTPQISCFRFHGPVSEFLRGAQTGILTRALNRFNILLGTEPDPARIQWIGFSAVLLRREMIAEIGGMDEGYFLYYEDCEYCLRAYRANWKICYVPDARVLHYSGGSGPVEANISARRRLPAYYFAGRNRFLYQAHGRLGPILSNLGWHAGRCIARARVLLGKKSPKAIEGEAVDIWINAFDPLGSRRAPDE